MTPSIFKQPPQDCSQLKIAAAFVIPLAYIGLHRWVYQPKQERQDAFQKWKSDEKNRAKVILNELEKQKEEFNGTTNTSQSPVRAASSAVIQDETDSLKKEREEKDKSRKNLLKELQNNHLDIQINQGRLQKLSSEKRKLEGVTSPAQPESSSTPTIPPTDSNATWVKNLITHPFKAAYGLCTRSPKPVEKPIQETLPKEPLNNERLESIDQESNELIGLIKTLTSEQNSIKGQLDVLNQEITDLSVSIETNETELEERENSQVKRQKRKSQINEKAAQIDDALKKWTQYSDSIKQMSTNHAPTDESRLDTALIATKRAPSFPPTYNSSNITRLTILGTYPVPLNSLMSSRLNFRQFPNLTTVNVSSCNLSAIPTSLIHLPYLSSLDLSSNQITVIRILEKMKRLQVVDLQNNPNVNVPSNYADRFPHNVRVILSQDPDNPKEDRTHGIRGVTILYKSCDKGESNISALDRTLKTNKSSLSLGSDDL